jgi:hypothetical protein
VKLGQNTTPKLSPIAVRLYGRSESVNEIILWIHILGSMLRVIASLILIFFPNPNDNPIPD